MPYRSLLLTKKQKQQGTGKAYSTYKPVLSEIQYIAWCSDWLTVGLDAPGALTVHYLVHNSERTRSQQLEAFLW